MSEAFYISPQLSIPWSEIELSAVRSSGPGGQHANKTSSAVQLRFFIPSSSLDEFYKTRLFAYSDNHISENGMIVIKAQDHRSQHRNRQEVLDRFQALLRAAFKPTVKRKATRPSYGVMKRRAKAKTEHSERKAARSKLKPRDY